MKSIFDRKSVFAKSLSLWSAFSVVATTSVPAFAAGTAVLGGNSELQNLTRVTMDKNDPNAAVFSSTASSGVLDWTKFNIGNGQSMTFDGVGTTFFNLVDGAAGKSQIDGIINGNGNVWVINPAGVAFGATAMVNVGGLFAAAAGNIENAAALRNGTSLMPSFSSFESAVTTADGSAFAADQVALLGKTVSAVGDFTGAGNLTLAGGSGMTVVEEIEGGKVSITITDFADDPSETSVMLGDLLVGDTYYGYNGGDLTVRSGNAVEVTGDAVAGGTVYVSTKNGDINIEKDANLETVGVGGALNLVSGMSYGGKGDINIKGSVKAENYYGNSTIYAGYGTGGIGAQGGDVNIDGFVSTDYIADIESLVGDVSTGADSSITVANGQALVSSTGDLSHNGTISGTGVTLYSYYGENGIVGNGSVDAGTSELMAYAATGDMVLYGKVSAADATIVANGAVALANGKNDFSGGVQAYGSSVMLSDANGIKLDGVTARNGTLNVFTGTGDIEVADSAIVTSPNGNVNLISAMMDGSEGDVVVNGNVTAGNVVKLYSGYGDTDYSTGSVAVNGYVNGKGGVNIYAFGGDIEGAGDVDATGANLLASANGNLVLDGTIYAKNATLASDTGSVLLRNSNNDFSGDVNAAGYVAVELIDINDISINSLIANDHVTAYTVLGDMTVNGTVSADSVRLASAVATGADGDLNVNGQVIGKGLSGSVFLQAPNGNVNVPGKVNTSTADFRAGGNVSVENSANTMTYFISARGEDVHIVNSTHTILGDITAGTGDVVVETSYGHMVVGSGATIKTEDGSIAMNTDSGSVALYDSSVVETNGGDITMSAKDADSAGNSELVVVAGSTVRSNGGDIGLSSDGATYVYGVVDAGNGNVSATAKGNLAVGGENASIKAKDANLTADGIVTTTGERALALSGKISANGTEVEITNGTAVDIGNVSATDGRVRILFGEGDTTLLKGSTVSAKSDSDKVATVDIFTANLDGANGNMTISGNIKAQDTATIGVRNNGSIKISNGAVVTSETGKVGIAAAGESNSSGSVVINGKVAAAEDVAIGSGMGSGSNGSVAINGSVTSGCTIDVWGGSTDGDVTINGSIKANGKGADVVIATGFEEGSNADITINGTIESIGGSGDGKVLLWAGLNSGASGNIRFGANGNVTSDGQVDVLARNGNLTQSGASVSVANGRGEAVNLHSAVTADIVNFNVQGNIGSGPYNYVAADGTIIGFASGNASIAAAQGKDFRGGTDTGGKPSIELNGHVYTVDWGSERPNSTLVAEGNLSVYTKGELQSNGLLYANNGDIIVTAAKFGDLSYLNAGRTLSVNNVGSPKHPKVAYFESINGKEPNIKNQPNDVVIFVDGRLAGGNLNILNQFGADEAFMVDTPELKSTQGIFGNPPFLHSDLDVANPMEVCAIDYMMQEVPRLTLSSDFPPDVDQNVEASGLSQKDVYWFGQKGAE